MVKERIFVRGRVWSREDSSSTDYCNGRIMPAVLHSILATATQNGKGTRIMKVPEIMSNGENLKLLRNGRMEDPGEN